MKRAVFLDRDGVVVENRPDHVKSWAEVQFLDGVFDAIRRLANSALAVVVVSNQGAVGRTLVTLETAWEVQRRIEAEIVAHGGRVDRSYICPHHPDDRCDCRKPAPGMLWRAAHELNLNLRQSWLVGDALTDLQAAQAANARGILVRTGRGAEQELLLPSPTPWPTVDNLAEAVEYILDHSEGIQT